MSAKHQSQDKKDEKSGIKSAEISDRAWAGEVVEIGEKVSGKQSGQQIRCKILDGPDTGKVMRRNVFGPVRIGDILMLKQTEIEAQQPRGRRG